MWVADAGNYQIREITIATGRVITLAGSGTRVAADGAGAAASFYLPLGITTDGSNLYVTDGNAIRKIVIASGIVTTLAGSNASAGNYTPLSVDGTGSAASFCSPTGITTDGTNLYVADYCNQKIRKVVIATGVVTTLAGTGARGAVDGIGTVSTFNDPSGITTDGTNLYVADARNNKIRKIDLSTNVVSTLAGSGTVGVMDSSGAVASFSLPNGVTKVGTSLYVADTSNKRVRKIAFSPTVTGMSSSTGVAGTVVTIMGANFDTTPANNTVKFNGNMATVIAANSSSLFVNVPSGATTGPVSVTTTGGTASLAGIFTVGLPTVTTMSSSTGVAGTSVTITGNNFDVTPANNTVRFNGTPATVTASTATSITTTVPSGATSGSVSVTTAGGTVTSPNSFSVGAPTVTGMTPSTGSAGTSVTLSGTNFDVTPANNTVSFNGTPATVTASTATSITATVPSGASPGSVSVATAGGTGTSASSFTVPLPPPPPPPTGTGGGTGGTTGGTTALIGKWQRPSCCYAGVIETITITSTTFTTDPSPVNGCTSTMSYTASGGVMNVTLVSSSCNSYSTSTASWTYSVVQYSSLTIGGVAYTYVGP